MKTLVCGLFVMFASSISFAQVEEVIPADAFVKSEISTFMNLIRSNDANRFNTIRFKTAEVVDFEKLSKAVLLDSWDKATLAQKKLFKETMKSLIESFYITKPGKSFVDNRLTVDEAIPGPGNKSTIVRCTVKQSDVDIGVEVELVLVNNEWQMKNITVDGLGLIEDYRFQFQNFLKKKSLDELIVRLQERIINNKR